MNKRNIKKLIESMQGKKKKKTSKKMSAVKEALIGRKYFSKGTDSMIRQAQTNYNGSYISGDLGGVSVSNPSLRKYYKGLI
jgi:hypothetical protein|tara:strand:+ start:297 stop:539 length:243 start_codon:yes stop_codon:yes gene_type:complete